MTAFFEKVSKQVKTMHDGHMSRKGDREFARAIANASSPSVREDLVAVWQRNLSSNS